MGARSEVPSMGDGSEAPSMGSEAASMGAGGSEAPSKGAGSEAPPVATVVTAIAMEEVDDLKVGALRAALAERGLSTEGKKKELAARLKEALGEEEQATAAEVVALDGEGDDGEEVAPKTKKKKKKKKDADGDNGDS